MKLFAPTANWDMTSSESWWPLIGSTPTSAGVRVSQETALTFAAAFAATRVISETMASLPCNIMRQVDERSSRREFGHPLHRVLHDTPNREQDIVTFMDMQVALQLNWGNAYSEVVRDQTGEVREIWPIHASRIPVSNITRNATDPSGWRQIIAGQPGELVYHVNNDDGTVTALPASDVLHVPGVLSSNGITGKAIPLVCPDALAIAVATNKHAGAFFKNGAVSNMALKSKKVVGKETAERLRDQWTRTFAGVHNHYKTILLEDEIEPVPFSIAPQASQLLESRQFAVNEIARMYRVPPHMLADLSRATWSNIEMEEISFLVHTMIPWIRRWEKALYRQLLTPKEQKRLYFKFNIMGLLRGDSASRAQFHKTMFDMGAASPNDIREREDLNPIGPEGDQYFVPGNNLIPLDKIGEMAQAQIDKMNAPTPAPVAPQESDTENLVGLLAAHEMRVVTAAENAVKSHSGEVQKAIEHVVEAVAERVVGSITPPPDFTERFESLESGVVALGDRVVEISKSVPSTTEIVESTKSVVETAVRDASEAAKEAVKQVEIAKNTAEIEEIASKRALLDEKQAEIDAKLSAERETTMLVFSLALKREIDKLAEWESKWLNKAVDAPLEWQKARQEFYARFKRYFVSNLGEYTESAALCGIVLDLEWGANQYERHSVTDLKSLDSIADDNYHDKLKEHVNIFRNNQWTDRSRNLANDLVERGVRLFQEKDNGQRTLAD